MLKRVLLFLLIAVVGLVAGLAGTIVAQRLRVRTVEYIQISIPELEERR